MPKKQAAKQTTVPIPRVLGCCDSVGSSPCGRVLYFFLGCLGLEFFGVYPEGRNTLRTSKYNVFTFLPFNLFEQLCKVSNLYFVIIMIIALIPNISPVSPVTTTLPVVIIFTVSMLRDLLEDLLRWRADLGANGRPVVRYDPQAETFRSDENSPKLLSARKCCCSEVSPGDLLLIRNDEPIPVDVVLLYCSNADGGAFLTTANLDGESNLKRRQAVYYGDDAIAKGSPLAAPDYVMDHRQFRRLELQLEPNTKRLDEFDGNLVAFPKEGVSFAERQKKGGAEEEEEDEGEGESGDRSRQEIVVEEEEEEEDVEEEEEEEQGEGADDEEEEEEKLSEDETEIVDQSSLVGGEEVISLSIDNFVPRGCVLKSKWAIGVAAYCGKQTKMSLNLKRRLVKWGKFDLKMNYFVIAMILCQQVIAWSAVAGFYVFRQKYGMRHWYVNRLMKSNKGEVFFFFQNVLSFVILVSWFIPISMFVTIDIVKGIQAKQMERNISHDGVNMVAKTFALNQDLACIDIVFSDKTGTLTQNRMCFAAAYISGVGVLRRTDPFPVSRKRDFATPMLFLKCVALNNTLTPSIDLGEVIPEDEERNVLFSKKWLEKIGSGALLQTGDGNDDDDEVLSEPAPVSSVGSINVSEDDSVVVREDDAASRDLARKKAKDANANRYLSFLYDGESTDERALVDRMVEDGKVVLLEHSRDSAVLSVCGRRREYEVLETIKFNSTRKRMTVCVREVDTGKVYVFVKGADSIVLARCVGGSEDSEEPVELLSPSIIDEESRVQQSKLVESCRDAVGDFAREGLRTLVLAYKRVELEDVQKLQSDIAAARRHAAVDSEESKKRIVQINDAFERDFRVLGATAIEDELQEDVPETVDFLRDAGMQVWCLTGDKVETGMTVCQTARLLRQESCRKIELTSRDYDSDEALSRMVVVAIRVLREADERVPLVEPDVDVDGVPIDYPDPNSFISEIVDPKVTDDFGLILDAKSLRAMMSDRFLQSFMMMIEMCKTVVCCRVSPAQKAEVVHLVQRRLRLRGLSVGDGANDVSMIQKAFIGVGLMGLEGSQAALASDYALPRFRCLVDLLAVEGRYCYIRNSDCVLINIHKNVLVCLLSVFHLFMNAVSGLVMIDGNILSAYNTFFHSLVPGVAGLVEKDINPYVIRKHPTLYKTLKRDDPYFNVRRMLYWFFVAVAQALIVFFLNVGNLGSSSGLAGGRLDTNGIHYTGYILISCCMMVEYLTNCIITKNWTMILVPAMFFGFFLYLLYILLCSQLRCVLGVCSLYAVPTNIMNLPRVYFDVMFVVAVSMIPLLLLKYVEQVFFPKDWQKLLAAQRRRNLTQAALVNLPREELAKIVDDDLRIAKDLKRWGDWLESQLSLSDSALMSELKKAFPAVDAAEWAEIKEEYWPEFRKYLTKKAAEDASQRTRALAEDKSSETDRRMKWFNLNAFFRGLGSRGKEGKVRTMMDRAIPIDGDDGLPAAALPPRPTIIVPDIESSDEVGQREEDGEKDMGESSDAED